jgi:hypothetical protein
MKINELLAEEQNNEGVGSFLGKGVGAVAQGVGAVAGAIPGAWERMKKGFAAGKATVAGDDVPSTDASGGTTTPAPTPSGTASTPSLTDPASIGGGAPAPTSGAAPTAAAPTASGTTTPAPTTGGAPAPTTGGAPAPAGSEPPATPAADQASKVGVGQINKLIPALRTRDLQSVKKTVDATIAKKTAEKQPATPAGQAPAAGTADSGAMANMANQLSGNKPNTMANAPVSKTNKAKPGNPNAAPAAPTQAELDADNERMATGTNEGKIVRFESRFLGMII